MSDYIHNFSFWLLNNSENTRRHSDLISTCCRKQVWEKCGLSCGYDWHHTRKVKTAQTCLKKKGGRRGVPVMTRQIFAQEHLFLTYTHTFPSILEQRPMSHTFPHKGTSDHSWLHKTIINRNKLWNMTMMKCWLGSTTVGVESAMSAGWKKLSYRS